MTSFLHSLTSPAAARHAQRLALATPEEALTHAQLLDQVSRIGAGLVATGVKAGDRVAILASNHPEAALILWASAWIGAIAVPVNTRLSRAETEAILEDCGAKVLVAEPDWLTWGNQTLTRIAIGASPNPATATVVGLRAFATTDALPVDDGAPLCLIYTAATEGTPKGAIITHGNLSASAEQLVQAWALSPHDAALGALPLFHIAGLSLYAAMLACGGATMLMRNFDAAQAARHIHDRSVNVMGTFSPMMEQILDRAAEADLSLTHLKAVFGLERPAVINRLAQVAPDTIFYVSYGQTETGGLVTTASQRDLPGSAGRSMHLSDVRVVDELDNDLPVGETGLIVVKGPTVSPGYWRHSPQSTPISERGWHETGDLGALNADGTLYFRGPALKKRLIKTGGENVYPAEVEQILRTCPGIADALVIGIADPEWGESVATLCVRQRDSDIDAEAISDYIASRIARYKRPRHIRFVAALPKTAQGQPDLDAAHRIFDEEVQQANSDFTNRSSSKPSSDPQPFAWIPGAEQIAGSVLTRFIRHTEMSDFDALARQADMNPGWLAEQVFEFCDFRFYQPYKEILDTRKGIAHADWCIGGTTNIVLNCLDRHRDTPVWNQTFLIWEGEDGTVVQRTYAQFDEDVCRLAGGLRELGVGTGDRVALYLPNIPEAFVALFAIFKLGAIAVPLFSGFGEQPLIARLLDAEASTVLTVDGSWRRGAFVPMKATLDIALQQYPGVTSVVVLNRHNQHDAVMQDGRDHDWATLVAAQEPQLATMEMPAEAPAVLLYTSGTTSKPKGCIWTHISFLASMALRDVHICGDFRSSDRFFFLSDMGWMVGPMSALLPAYFGASVLLVEGAPDYPRRDRFWKLVDDHEVTYLGVSPTIVRSLMRHGTEDVQKYDFSNLRIACSGGEPWNDAAWQWFFENVCRRDKPIINLVGGTEVCGCNFIGTVHHPMLPGSFGARGLGCGVDIVDEGGKSVGDEVVGELILRQPGIGMTKSLWRDDERYLDTYWRTLPDVWVHGDFAKRNRHGLYYVLGRSDDTIKVAGKRTGPAELESVLTDTGEVSEAAVIGIPDPMTGSALVCVCVPMPGVDMSDALSKRLSAALVSRMGPTYRPRQVFIVADLPKTRNMKIMRRVIRAILLKQSPGDLSALSNPESINALTRSFEEHVT